MNESSRIFGGRTLVVAFEGWNDAADSASNVAKFICEKISADVVATVDSEDYYDFQFTRPTVSFDKDGKREITWPSADFCVPGADALVEHPEYSNLNVLIGTEPSRRWQSFTAEVMEMIDDREIDAVVFLGAMLADVPHSRPISVSSTSQNERVRAELNAERSQYEGPVGILSVLGIALEKANIPSIALWASVPHYVHNTPSPKATLALLIEIENLLAAHGYEHYETSAFAKKGQQARHNLNYWQFGDYLGIGAGAHSKLSYHDKITRETRAKHPKAYMEQASQGNALERVWEISRDELGFEFMMNALRLIEGVPLGLFQQRTGLSLNTLDAAIKTAQNKGLLSLEHGRIQPTPLGQRFLNELLELFLN